MLFVLVESWLMCEAQVRTAVQPHARVNGTMAPCGAVADREPLWVTSLYNPTRGEQDIGDPAFVEGIVLLGGGMSAFGLNASSGRVMWNITYPEGDKPRKKSPGYWGNVTFFETQDGRLHGLSIYDGKEVWSFLGRPDGGWLSRPKAANGIVYTASPHYLFAVNAVTGSLIWNVSVDNVKGGPVTLTLTANGTIFQLSDHHYNSFDGSTGRTIWSVPVTISPNGATPGEVCGSNVIFLLTQPYSASMVAFDFSTGRMVWNRTIPTSNATNQNNYALSTPSYHGKVFVGYNNYMMAFECGTGKLVWTFGLSNPSWGTTSPFIDQGVVVFGADDNTLHVLDESTGVERWSVLVGGDCWSDPIIVNNRVFFGAENGDVYSLCLGTLPPNSNSGGGGGGNGNDDTEGLAAWKLVLIVLGSVALILVAAFAIKRVWSLSEGDSTDDDRRKLSADYR